MNIARKQRRGGVKHSLLVTNCRAKRTNKQPNGHDNDDGRVMDPFCRPIDFIKDSSLLNIKVWRSNNVPSSSKLSVPSRSFPYCSVDWSRTNNNTTRRLLARLYWSPPWCTVFIVVARLKDQDIHPSTIYNHYVVLHHGLLGSIAKQSQGNRQTLTQHTDRQRKGHTQTHKKRGLGNVATSNRLEKET